MLTVGSLFSGIGGFDLGFERAGMRVVWQSEIDEAACKVLAHHWPEVPNLGDITRVRLDRAGGNGGRVPTAAGGGVDVDRPGGGGSRGNPLPAGVDLVCGGFPCQDLSVAGKRAGLAGERSGLFHEFIRTADTLRPRWVVIENVPGLLSSNDGRDMGTVLNVLADVGYEDISWRVVDSLNFGVPQRRRRVFIVGRLGAGTATRQVLLECEGRPWRPPSGREAGARVAALTADGVGTCGADDNQGQAGHLIPAVAHAVKAREAKGVSQRESDTTLVPVGFHTTQDPISLPGAALPLETGNHHQTQAVAVQARVRRLTPTECERLQAFPDRWTEPAGSDGARYRCLGNAVTVNVAHWLGSRIAAYENGALT